MTITEKSQQEVIAAYVERTTEELRTCVDQLPTAAEVIESFERFTMHLHTIGEWVDSLGLAAEEGVMVDEVERLEKLITEITMVIPAVAGGRVCYDHAVASATAATLVSMTTRSADLMSALTGKTRDVWYWPTCESAAPRPE